MSAEDAVAVIGLGALFPKAPDVRTFWENIVGGKDCIDELPDSRSDPRFLDPSTDDVDRIPTRRGGFIGESLRFDAGAHGIMPVAAMGAEPDQLAALAVAAACLEDAGYADKDFDRSRAAVILGRGSYLTSGQIRLNRKVRGVNQVLQVLQDVVPGISASQLAEVKQRFQDAAGPYGPDTAIGLVPNLAASRIAHRLDFQGPAYTLDAACASSLLAVEHGMREVRSGRCEIALVGGIHLTHDINFWTVFAQLGALSRSGSIRPFDANADGLLIGEGIGILALKRLDRAREDGDRIYASLPGVGSGSDGRAASVMQPRVGGQILALQRAWQDAGLDPQRAGLIEAHGTATAAGDAAELETIATIFGEAQGVLGSVKSMIGHTMPAAGAAGLIKAVLAVHHGIRPPSLHCDTPHRGLADSGWRVIPKAESWEGERVAAVNAFGFGGINAHVVVQAEGASVASQPRAKRPADRADVQVLALAAASPEALLDALDAGELRGGTGPCRLAVVDPTPERLVRAREIVARWKPWTGRRGIWFRPHGLLQDGEVAFLFPGIEAQFAPDVASLAARFNRPPPPHMRPSDLEETGRGVVELGRFLWKILREVGIRPHRVAGHSIGEWSAMIAANVIPDAEVSAFLDRIPGGDFEVPGVAFAAVACGWAQAEAALEGLEDIAISHDNCPHQILLCGKDEPIEVARTRLVEQGVVCQVLPFRSGFHSPLFKDYVAPMLAHLETFTLNPAELPLYSATLADRFPDAPDAVRALAMEHLVAPLRWRELIERLHDDGVRVFVQLGTGSLPGFVRDTLAGKPHHAMTAIEPRRNGLVQLRNLLLALFVEGLDVPLEKFVPKAAKVSVQLPLGNPLIRVEGITVGAATSLPASVPESMKEALNRTLADLRRGPLEVVAALNTRSTATARRVLSVDTVPALRDHSFFPQPEGWTVVSDIHPVVPMTMTIELLKQIASELAPEQVCVEIANIEAMKWLIVCPPVEVEMRARREGAWIRAEVVGYASARVRFAPAFPVGTPALPDLEDPKESSRTPTSVYTGKWLFHGPDYQGITTLGPWDATGMDGVLTVPPGPGALLDNAGQILGSWLVEHSAVDPLAMPVGIQSMAFFGPDPAVGETVVCRVRITEISARSLVGDIELLVDGSLWCRITQWADHRFETSERMWVVMRKSQTEVLSVDQGGWWLHDDQAERPPSRDWLSRRYLGEAEREAMRQTRRPRQYLNDAVARKDAVRALLWSEGAGPLFPVETPTEGVFASTDHDGPLSVAIAGRTPVGIAIDPDPVAAVRRARAARAALGGEPEDVVETCLVEQASLGELTVAWTGG